MNALFKGWSHRRPGIGWAWGWAALFFLVAAPMTNAQDFSWRTNSGTITITGYIGAGGAASIPGSINGLTVSAIGEQAFYGCTSLTSLAISAGVVTIGSEAFAYCSRLASITVDPANIVYSSENGVVFNTGKRTLFYYPGGKTGPYTVPSIVTNIEDSAFLGCTNLTGVTIQNAVINIGRFAFQGCNSLTSVTIPNSVTTIGDMAFYGCDNLTSVTIGKGASLIGEAAFAACPKLAAITVNALNLDYSSYDGVLFDIGQAILLQCPGGKIGDYVVVNSVTSIGNWAFEGCASLTSISIGSNVVSVGAGAFTRCSRLTMITVDEQNADFSSVNGVLFDKHQTMLIGYPGGKAASYMVPDSVTQIGDGAFSSCDNLTSVMLGSNVTHIGNSAFKDCADLTGVYCTGNAPGVGAGVFDGAIQATVYYLSDANGWGDSFAGRPSVPWPAMDDFTFTINSVDTNTATLVQYTGHGGAVIIPPFLEYMGGKMVTDIGSSAFESCTGLTSVTIPQSVVSIGSAAFFYCTSLTNVTIPDSVASIGSSVFSGCIGLTSITIPDSVGSIGGYTFGECSALTNIVIGNGVNSIGEELFYGCSNMTDVTIPASVFSIEDAAFSGCTGLTNVLIGSNVASIGVAAFSGCSGLTSVTIPASVGSIELHAFGGCTGLTAIIVDDGNAVYRSLNGVLFDISLAILNQCPGGKAGNYTIPVSVISIGDSAFQGCAGLTNVVIGNSVASIGKRSFSYCTGLTNVVIGSSVASIGKDAFYGCTGLTSVMIPASVTGIEQGALSGCGGLSGIMVDEGNSAYSSSNGVLFNKDRTTLIQCPGGKAGAYVIPFGVINIGESAFTGCGGLVNITVPASTTAIDLFSFSGCTNLASAYFMGDAPDAPFPNFDSITTVYHLPDSLGWPLVPDPWGGVPTALWLPEAQCDGSVGVQNGKFGFNIGWAEGQTVVVDACTNLANPVWVPLATNTLNGSTYYFVDSNWTNYPGRYYRIRSL